MANYTFGETVVVLDATDGTKLGGINNAGEVTGYDAGFGPDHYNHAFTYTHGQISPFALPNARPNTTANGINNAGQVVGINGTSPTGVVGYVRAADGSVQQIPVRPPFQSGSFDRAFGINDYGQVVGEDSAHDTHHEGFLWQNGAMSLIQFPGASATEAHGINNSGVIVGTANNYGFIDFGGQMSLLGIAGATVVDPMAISSNDVVVGSFYDGTHWHGFIDNGEMSFIDETGAADTWITGINSKGTLVGYSDATTNGPTQGFIARDPTTTLVREEYVAGLGRDADGPSLNFWTDVLKAGTLTARDFVTALTGTADFQKLHGGQSNGQYVDSLYVNALGRHAEPQTKAAWSSVMNAGASRGDVMSAIATSPEGQLHFAATHG